MEEQYTEVNLGGILRFILQAWRRVIAVAVLLAILMGGTKYVRLNSVQRGKTSKEENTSPAQEEQFSHMGSLSAGELKDVEDVLRKETAYRKRQDYMDRSLRMKINPFEVYTGELIYFVDTHHVIDYSGKTPKDLTDDILEAYCTALKNSEWKKKAMNEIAPDAELPYFDELIRAYVEGDMLHICFEYSSPEGVRAFLDAAESHVREAESGIRQHYGQAFDIGLIDTLELCTVDEELYDFQYSQETAQRDLKVGVESKKLGFTPKQTAYYREALAGGEEVIPKPKEAEAAPPLKSAVRSAVLGGVLGVFLTAAWYAVSYLRTDKVKREDDLEKILNVPMLGIVECTGKQGKNHTAKLDRCIDSIGKNSIRGMSREQQLGAVTEGIVLYCRDRGIKKVCFYGAEGHMEDQVHDMEKLLREQGLDCVRENDIYEAAARLDEQGGAVLLVKEGVTGLSRLRSEVKFCLDHKKNVLGAVLEA